VTLTRRGFLAGAALPVPATAPTQQQQQRPNIVFILADDLGWGELSCQGQKFFQTPHIDALASQGTRFTSAYSGSPVCAPSRCTLITGLHTGHARVRGNHDGRGGRTGLRKTDATIAELLQKSGYRTGLIGKWGLGEEGTQGVPSSKGFDHFFGFLNQDQAAEHYPKFLWRNGEKALLDGKQYAQGLFTEEGLRFIDASGGKPFFLEMAYTLPHAEFVAPEDDLKPYRGLFAKAKTPMKRGSLDKLETMVAMIARLDRDVGALMKHLDARGLTRDTIVMFASDNGPHNNDREVGYMKSAGGFRGNKGDVYEGGLRVPFIARWPGRIPAGRVTDRPIAFWDLPLTLADLTGLVWTGGSDGESFAAHLTGSGGSARRARPLYWEYRTRRTPQQAGRIGAWKGLRVGGREAPIEIFHLATDPAESHNLAAHQPELVRRFSALFEEERTESEDFPLE
jgi:arylsulfatase A-like enzyme